MMSNSDLPKEKFYWKSLEEYQNPSLIKANKENEFVEGVTDEFVPDDMSVMNRRKFLTLLSASAAFTAAGCSDYQDKGEIIPYNQRPDEVLPGRANYYASTCTGCSAGCGILVKTREGRPIKIEGNPDHPVNKGKICVTGQASILNLYDPERLREPFANGRTSNWKKVDTEIIAKLQNAVAENKEIAFITNTVNSPSTKRLLNEFQNKYPGSKIYSFEQFNNSKRVSAWEKCYATSSLPSVKFNEASIIVSLESDFLARDNNFIEYSRKFSETRDIVNGKKVSRLYAVEAGMSLTGTNSDYRLRLKKSAQGEFAAAILNELQPGTLNTISLAAVSKKYSLNDNLLQKLIHDLKTNKSKSIIYAGDDLPESVHVIVNKINDLLGGSALYDFENPMVPFHYTAATDWEDFVNKMNSGEVAVVINFDSNPVFNLAGDIKFAEALNNVQTKISLVESKNETSLDSNYVLPINNVLENWGDVLSRAGTYTTVQPVIAPLFNTRQKEAVIQNWIFEFENFNHENYRQFVEDTCKTEIYEKQNFAFDFKSYWYKTLHDGITLIPVVASSDKTFNSKALKNLSIDSTQDDLEIVIQKSYFIGDGRFANNGWLQEIPHPVTKTTWDNYAALSPLMAKEYSLKNNDIIEIKSGDKMLAIPILVQPGIAEKTISIEAGYGRNTVGVVGKGVGFNPNNLISKDTESFVVKNISVNKTGDTYKLISTQEHHAIDDEFVKDFHKIRGIIKEGTVAEYEKDHGFLHKEGHSVFNIGETREYKDSKWGMVIDLNKCTGCSICVASCNVENNIPVVGKDQVEVGREMHWVRLDRYYSGTPEEPDVSLQPTLCSHCDNAPCENVCPVNATNHSKDGLNQMVYNRCVGTRYCANNCPYKVRRFNFFNFRDNFADAHYKNELTNLSFNPEVTVRSRGVMEKCTFCIQRIMEAKSTAIAEGRKLADGDVVTACQQACPTNAIIFGDKNKLDSHIQKYIHHDLSYHVLEETNIRPNVTFLAKLRNTHSEDE